MDEAQFEIAGIGALCGTEEIGVELMMRWALVLFGWFFLTASPVFAETTTLVLRDGRVWEGRVFDLGGAGLEVTRRGGRRTVSKVEVERWAWSAGEAPEDEKELPWLMILLDGHELSGQIRYLEGRDEWAVDLANGTGEAKYPTASVVRVVQPSGIGSDESFTPRRDFDRRLARAIDDVLSDEIGRNKSGTEFIRRAVYFAIPKIEKILNGGPKGAARPSDAALRRLELLIIPERIRIGLPLRLLNSIPNIVEILTSGKPQERVEALRTGFLETGADVYPLFVSVLLDTGQPAQVRGFIVDLLQRTHRVSELVAVYQEATGVAQFAVAVALADAGIYVGLPTLIESLRIEGVELVEPGSGDRSKTVDIRELAIRKLEEYTGERHGFSVDASGPEREVAVVRWEQWWLQHKDKADEILGFRLESALDNPIRDRANRLWREGVSHWNERKVAVAKQLFQQAIEADPTCLGPLVCLGIVAYKGEGDLSGAKEWFRRALRRKSEPGEEQLLRLAYSHLGQIALLDLDYEAAEGFYRQAINLDAQHADTWLDLGNAIYRQALTATEATVEARRTSFQRASRAYQDGLKKIQEFRGSLVFLTSANLPIGRDLPFKTRDHNRSLKDLRERLQRSEGDFLYRISRVELAIGNSEEALKWIKKAIELPVVTAEHHKLAARIYRRLGQTQEEKRHLAAAERLSKG